MRAIRLGLLELLRFRRPMQRLGLVFLAVVPLLYGAIYLWSNWNPYGKIKNVPVAVVNEDQPVVVDGRTVDAGDQFVSQLRSNPLLGWHFVNAARASKGLNDGRYYAIITVPSDFTAKLASGATGTPQRAAMQIRLDDANNFLVGIMAETIQSELQRQISAAAVTAYFQTAGNQLGKLQSGLQQAATGAGKLNDGLGQAAQGTTKLASGLTALKKGTAQLAPGASQVSAGVSKIAGIGVPLANRAADLLPILVAHAADLADLADRLTAGAAEHIRSFADFSDAVVVTLRKLGDDHPWVRSLPSFQQALAAAQNHQADLVAFLEKLRQDAPTLAKDPVFQAALGFARQADATLTGLLKKIAKDHPELLTDPIYQALLTLAQRIDTAADRLADLAETVHGRVAQVAQAVHCLQCHVPEIQAKLRGAAAGLTKLDNGAKKVATGAKALDKGAGTAVTGAQALDQAEKKLHKGAGDLAKGLNQASGQIPSINNDEAKTLATPVNVSKSNAHPAGVYGRGLAPFFFPIALWVFGIVAFLMLKPVSGRLLAEGRTGVVTTAFAAWTPVIVMGSIGAMLLLAVCDLALGLDPVDLPGTAGIMLLGIAAFSAIVHWLRLLLGAAGDAAALFLLMVQLVSCGGLYPVETLPEPFRSIHPLIPMTYLVKALRVTISGGNSGILADSALILAGYLVAALALLVGTVRLRRTWTMGTYKPDLEL